MRLTSACLAIGLTGLAAATVPAHAGDLNNGAAGGIQDYSSGGVPVPVPQTYNENFKYYLRGDIGAAFANSGTVSNDGMPLNVISPNDWASQSILSFGFGRYITPSLRAEFTVDYLTNRQLASKNPTTADVTLTKTGLNGALPETDVSLFHGIQSEDISYQNSVFMLSGFYDFNNAGRLKPYIGAGFGFARHDLRRTGADVYTCDPTASTFTLGGLTSAGCGSVLLSPMVATASAQNVGYGLAAQASAGVTYDLTPRTHWETGYRMVWQSGHVGVVSAEGLNGVHLADQVNHEIRTGVRWDLW